MAYNDDLQRWAAAAAIRSAQNEMRTAQRDLEDSAADPKNADHDLAADAYRRLIAANDTIARLTPQPSATLTSEEANWLNERPSIAQDPDRMREVQRVYAQLQAAGLQRGSAEALEALALRLDASRDGVSGDAAGDLTPDAVVKMCGIDADTYNKGVHDLQLRKARGDYK